MKNPKQNHYYVNWVDGMKINKSHFQDSDNANIALITKATSIVVNQNHYGLLPSLNEDSSSDSIQLSLDGQNTLSVQVSKCKAVTQGGYFIDISTETNALQDAKGKFASVGVKLDVENLSEENLYIVLNINPYSKIAIGEANVEEEPPRHPYVMPAFNLNVIVEDQISDASLGDGFLIIGKIVMNGGAPQLDPNYIPPCYSIQSNQDLVYIYSEIGVFFNAIEKYCLQIIQKIFQKKQSKT